MYTVFGPRLSGGHGVSMTAAAPSRERPRLDGHLWSCTGPGDGARPVREVQAAMVGLARAG